MLIRKCTRGDLIELTDAAGRKVRVSVENVSEVTGHLTMNFAVSDNWYVVTICHGNHFDLGQSDDFGGRVRFVNYKGGRNTGNVRIALEADESVAYLFVAGKGVAA